MIHNRLFSENMNTVFCQETGFLSTQVIYLTDILIILGLQFTQLVLKSTAHLFKVSLEKKKEEHGNIDYLVNCTNVGIEVPLK